MQIEVWETEYDLRVGNGNFFFSCFKTLRDIVISRVLCAKLCSWDIRELLILRYSKWPMPPMNPRQDRVRSSPVRKPPPRNAVQWSYCYASLSSTPFLTQGSVFAPAVPLREGHLTSFSLPQSLLMLSGYNMVSHLLCDALLSHQKPCPPLYVQGLPIETAWFSVWMCIHCLHTTVIHTC